MTSIVLPVEVIAAWREILPRAPDARLVLRHSGLMSDFPLMLSARNILPLWDVFMSDKQVVRLLNEDDVKYHRIIATLTRYAQQKQQQPLRVGQRQQPPLPTLMRTPLLPGVTWRPLAVPLPWSADCSAPSELALEAGEQLCVVSPWHEDNASVVMVLNAGASEWQTTIVKSHFRVLLASAREMLNRESDNVHERLERNAEIAFACLNRHTGVKARRDEARSVELLERFLSSRGEDDNDGKRGAQRVR